jgi:hypothetical protein
MMVAAKSEDLEFFPPYPGNFSNIDTQSYQLSFSVRPLSDTQQAQKNPLSGGANYLYHLKEPG